MLKIPVEKARMHGTATFRVSGSAVADSVQAEVVGIATRLERQSPATPAQVARLVRTAERGCFIMQARQRPVPITTMTLLNGARLA